MATTAQNNVDVAPRSFQTKLLPVTTNLTINEGDLVYWDNVNYTVTPLTSSSNVATYFLGMALQSNAQLVYPNDPDQWGILVMVRGVVWMSTTSGDTYNWFDKVTVGATSQTITNQSATNNVGYAIIPGNPSTTPRAHQATPTPETVSGGTGVRIQVQLEPKHVYAVAI